MTKKRYLIGLVSAVIIIIATLIILKAENQDDKKKSFAIDLYFMNENYSSIVAEKRSIEYEDIDKLPRLVIEALAKGPLDNKNKPIFENEIKILSIREKRDDLIIDFSKDFISSDESKTLLATYAVAKSLCQLNKVDRVLITVENEEISVSDGTVIGYLSNSDIDLVSDTTTKDSKILTLYFADKETNKLVNEKRVIKITDTLPVEQYVVNELIKGTQTNTSKSIISADTQLISAETTDGTCFVNFKSGFIEKNSGNPENEKLVIYSIVNSLCDIETVEAVQFLVDGKKTENFGSINISDVFKCNKSLIKN